MKERRLIVAKLGKLGVVVGVLLLASGCASGPSHTGSAATVGSYVIKQDVVTNQLREVMSQISQMPATTTPPSASAVGQAIVNRLVITKIVDTALKSLKIKVTDSQIQQFKNQVYAQYGGQSSVDGQLATTQGMPASQADSVFKTYLGEGLIGSTLLPKGTSQQRNQATSQYLLMLGSATKIEVAPRYGTWDPTQLAAAGVDNALSTLAPTGQ